MLRSDGVHAAGKPADEGADAGGIVAVDVVACPVQLHDDALVGIRERRHDDGLVGVRAEPDRYLVARRLLEYRRRSQAQQALAGDEDLSVVVAGQDDGADARAAEPGKEVEDELLADVAGHRVVEDVARDDDGIDLLGLRGCKQLFQQLPGLVEPVQPSQRASDMPVGGMQ